MVYLEVIKVFNVFVSRLLESPGLDIITLKKNCHKNVGIVRLYICT